MREAALCTQPGLRICVIWQVPAVEQFPILAYLSTSWGESNLESKIWRLQSPVISPVGLVESSGSARLKTRWVDQTCPSRSSTYEVWLTLWWLDQEHQGLLMTTSADLEHVPVTGFVGMIADASG